MRTVFDTPAKVLSALAFLVFAVWNIFIWDGPSEAIAVPVVYYGVVCWMAGWSYQEDGNLWMSIIAAASGVVWCIPTPDGRLWWTRQIAALILSGFVLVVQFTRNRHFVEKASAAIHE